MPNVSSRRDALVAAGLAKPGRGRLSREALAWLDAERAKGVTFSDDAPVKSAPAATGPVKTDKPVSTGMPEYLFPDEYRFPEEEYRAYAQVGNKRIEYGMRECCNSCKVSLVNHSCNSPTIHDSIMVTIEKR